MKKRRKEVQFKNGMVPSGSEIPDWWIWEKRREMDYQEIASDFFSCLTLKEKDDFTALFTQQSSREYGEMVGIGHDTAWRRLKSIKAKWDKHLAS